MARPRSKKKIVQPAVFSFFGDQRRVHLPQSVPRKRSRRNGGREASDLRGVRAADAAPATRPLETGGFVGLGHGDWAGHGLLLVVFVCCLFGKPKGTYVVVVFLPYLGFPLFHLGAQRDSDWEPTHGWKLVGFPIPALCQAVFPPPDPPSQKLTAKMLER